MAPSWPVKLSRRDSGKSPSKKPEDEEADELPLPKTAPKKIGLGRGTPAGGSNPSRSPSPATSPNTASPTPAPAAGSKVVPLPGQAKKGSVIVTKAAGSPAKLPAGGYGGPKKFVLPKIT